MQFKSSSAPPHCCWSWSTTLAAAAAEAAGLAGPATGAEPSAREAEGEEAAGQAPSSAMARPMLRAAQRPKSPRRAGKKKTRSDPELGGCASASPAPHVNGLAKRSAPRTRSQNLRSPENQNANAFLKNKGPLWGPPRPYKLSLRASLWGRNAAPFLVPPDGPGPSLWQLSASELGALEATLQGTTGTGAHRGGLSPDSP